MLPIALGAQPMIFLLFVCFRVSDSFDVMSVLIGVQTVCNGYQQMTKVATSNLQAVTNNLEGPKNFDGN